MISQPTSLVRGFALVIASCIAVSACSSQQPVASAGATQSQTQSQTQSRAEQPRTPGERAAKVAESQIGTPYRYGGTTPSGFDCSGLVYYSYASIGKQVPRTTGELWKTALPVGRRDLRSGDILFFSISGKMSHVGMYIGNDRFVHAPSSGKVVSIQSLNSDFYSKAYLRAGRL